MTKNQQLRSLAIRMPIDMHEQIRQSAASNHRSMNSEIVYTLEQALPAEQKETAPGDKIAVHAPDAAQS